MRELYNIILYHIIPASCTRMYMHVLYVIAHTLRLPERPVGEKDNKQKERVSMSLYILYYSIYR